MYFDAFSVKLVYLWSFMVILVIYMVKKVHLAHKWP